MSSHLLSKLTANSLLISNGGYSLTHTYYGHMDTYHYVVYKSFVEETSGT